MKNFFKIIFLIAIGFTAFYYRDQLKNIWTQSYNQFFPCKQPISYSVNAFDTRFGISKTDFINSIKIAEDIWEKPLDKNLFSYLPEKGVLKINLIYDERQKVTTDIKNIEVIVDNSRTSYDLLVTKYKALVTDYSQSNASFETRVNAYEERKKIYESMISQVNRKGRVNADIVEDLSSERDYLNNEVNNLRQLQDNLNNEVKEINILVDKINQTAKTLNLNVDRINSIGDTLPHEFNEGIYRSSLDGQEIDIYQFDDKTKLIRVLAHELGHALGLDHIEDNKAIMYRLNNGINEKLTENDLTIIKEKCKMN